MFVSFFFFKQKTAYEMRISDWSSDVCSSDLSSETCPEGARGAHHGPLHRAQHLRSGALTAVSASWWSDATATLDSLIAAASRHKIGRASCRERVCPYV